MYNYVKYFMCIFHLMRKPLSKFNSKLVECRHPVTNGHGPLLGKRVHGQRRDDLGDGHLGGKNVVMGVTLCEDM